MSEQPEITRGAQWRSIALIALPLAAIVYPVILLVPPAAQWVLLVAQVGLASLGAYAWFRESQEREKWIDRMMAESDRCAAGYVTRDGRRTTTG